jgi:hypothetical protein
MYANMVGLGIGPVILILMFWASVQEAGRAPARTSTTADSAAAREQPTFTAAWPRPELG